MVWIIVIAIVIGLLLDSKLGKIVLGAGVAALGLWLLSWITEIDFFLTLVKICGVAVVVIIVGLIIKAIVDA